MNGNLTGDTYNIYELNLMLIADRTIRSTKLNLINFQRPIPT